MKKLTANVLLLVALVLPVALFLGLLSRGLLGDLSAAVVSVVTGWALNVAWAYTAVGSNVQATADEGQNYVTVATRYGWACPAVLVLITWLVWRFVLGHST
jgi:hypothetical protein